MNSSDQTIICSNTHIIRTFMGCTSSVSAHEPDLCKEHPIKKLRPRQTRIIQEEEVDVFINDEYYTINKDWSDLHGAFLADVIEEHELSGNWKAGINSGGSRNDLELFSTNPQYLLILGPPEKHPKNDEFYLPNRNFIGIDVSFCLTQTTAAAPLHVAFFIYKTDNMKERLTAEYFLCMPPEGDTGAFVNWKQVHQRFRLQPGLYIIIPAAFHPGKEGSFVLTVKAPPPVSLHQFPPCTSLSRESSFHIIPLNGTEEKEKPL